MKARNTKKDLKLLAKMFFENLHFNDGCEYGSPSLDMKRPFGNSDVEGDILEIIGLIPEEDDEYSKQEIDYARELYTELLIPYLQEKCTPLFK